MLLNLRGLDDDQEQTRLRGGQIRGKHLNEKRSARQYRPHSVAEFAAQYGDHHDPVCRAAGRRCGGSGTDLEPLIFSQARCAFAAMVSER
jgi:hypothetical protein